MKREVRHTLDNEEELDAVRIELESKGYSIEDRSVIRGNECVGYLYDNDVRYGWLEFDGIATSDKELEEVLLKFFERSVSDSK